MKTIICVLSNGLLRLGGLSLVACVLAVLPARAGLTVDVHLYHTVYGYYFFPFLSTNTTPPGHPLGDYTIASPQIPANGSQLYYRATANSFDYGINGNLGGGSYYQDFDSFLYGITNGQWSITVTNATSTNHYSFTVKVTGLTSNSIGAAVVSVFPTNGAVNVTNQPLFSWTGPTNWAGGLYVQAGFIDTNGNYTYETSAGLPPNQTTWPCPVVLPDGTNDFYVDYSSNVTALVIASTPTNGSAQPISGWISTANVDSSFGNDLQFTVGAQAPGILTGGHTNVAYYSFEDDNLFAQDYSGQGNNINGYGNFGGSTNAPYMTNNAAAGSFAVGYTGAGWQSPPTNLVATLAGSFSISLWAKTSEHRGNDSDTADSGAGLLAANSDQVIPMALTGNKLAFLTGGGSLDTLHSAASINTGSYVHLVVTRDQQSGEKKIYVNGNLDASDFGSTGQLSTGSNPSLYLGMNSTFSGGLIGQMDEVQIYSGVLSSNEVTYLHEHPGTNVADVVGQGGFNGINIVSNGGFETGDFTGWAADDSSGDVNSDSTYVHSGTNGANFGAVGALGYISQTLSTTPGTSYLLSFWLASPDGETPNEFQVSWNGTVLLDETDLPAFGWTNLQFTVTATNASTVLQFGFRDDPTYLGLDDVSVVSTSAGPPVPVSVSFNLQIQRYQDFTYGYTNYDASPQITFVDPVPVTTNIVVSPDGYMFSEVWPGDSSQDNSSGEGFNSLDDLIYACTNGQWTLYVNKGDPGQQVFHFNVSVNGLTTNLLGPVSILVPSANATGVATNSPIQWSGPANYSSVFVEAYQYYPTFAWDGYTSLPSDATNWPSPPALLVGTNFLYVQFASNNFPNVTFTTPVNGSLNTVSNWDTEVDLYSQASMTFVVGGSGPLQALLIPLLQPAGGIFQLSFQTQDGHTETLQSTTNLNGLWMDVTNFMGDGSVWQFTFPTTNSVDEYFRVKTQ